MSKHHPHPHVPPAAELSSDFDYLTITKPEKSFTSTFNVFKTPFKNLKPANAFSLKLGEKRGIESRYSSPKIKEESRSSLASSPGSGTQVKRQNDTPVKQDEAKRRQQSSLPLTPESMKNINILLKPNYLAWSVVFYCTV